MPTSDDYLTMTTEQLLEELALLKHTKKNVLAEAKDAKAAMRDDKATIKACRDSIRHNKQVFGALKVEAKDLLKRTRELKGLIGQAK